MSPILREGPSMFIKGYWKMFTKKKLENVQEVEAMQIWEKLRL